MRKSVLGSLQLSITITEDPKIPNAATIFMRKQDHTMGNMIRASVRVKSPFAAPADDE